MSPSIITAVLSLLAYLLPLIVEGIKGYQERRKGADHEANIQEFRKALGKRNPAAVDACLADQHDRVRAALGGR